ncbi:TIGR00159 family protein [Pontibacter sp. BT310]|uniref:Diadenylate cyclase n=1 Tax=Pontibacter populi TaxID=890055 RepID=A0ABS6XAR3_9BACT|nr:MULTISPECIES: diadenylate cyclase CdaA [Pontibacter]MBJ6117412.1 TIGR00159 family protein [Pontibacter sp. BT310]MBR0569837.1 diadenylate cyclase CdaA [Microvirga sp. STS03]MBW3364265.1 diadenylate cyclase CdaA [Pontibacter populi]
MTFLFTIGFLEIELLDIIDILLVTALLYQLYKLLTGSVALKIFLGLLSIYLLYLVVRAAGMELLSIILGQFMGVGVLAAIILFQPEIRRFLLMIGKTTALNHERFWGFPWRRDTTEKLSLTPFIEAAKSLAAKNTGALIVFAKSSELKYYAESGDLIDAVISKRLLMSIFNKNSPLHDGAVIIANNRIKAARCILPVSENQEIPASMGLRHRAAIGLTEITDSIVLVVSEETGQVALVRNGEAFRNLSSADLRVKLNQFLFDTDQRPTISPSEKSVSAA